MGPGWWESYFSTGNWMVEISAGWSSLTAVDPWCWNPLSESRTNILAKYVSDFWSSDHVGHVTRWLFTVMLLCYGQMSNVKKNLKCDICSHILISFPLFSSSSLFIYSLVIRHSMFELVAAHRGSFFSLIYSSPLPSCCRLYSRWLFKTPAVPGSPSKAFWEHGSAGAESFGTKAI